MPPVPPTLLDELIGEILLRLPPDKPQWLFRVERTSCLQLNPCIRMSPPFLVRDALYFICVGHALILRYDLGGDRALSVIKLPDSYKDGIALMPVEDGALGLSGLDRFTLHLWSLKTGADGVEGWDKRPIINLKIAPICRQSYSPCLIGFAEGCDSDVIFVSTDVGIVKVDLISERVTKVCELVDFCAIFPYTSFCTPGASALQSLSSCLSASI